MRYWNWMCQSDEDIERYVSLLKNDLHKVYVSFPPFGYCANLTTDDKPIADSFAYRYCDLVISEKQYLLSPPQKKMNLIYFTRSRSVTCKAFNTPNGKLSSSKKRTDIIFSPISTTALMHGPQKIGFIKSLFLGLASFRSVDNNFFGMHSGVVKIDGNNGIAFVGPHGAGKTTYTTLFSIELLNAKLVTDDWGMFSLDKKNLLDCLGAEKHIQVEYEQFQKVLRQSKVSGSVLNKKLKKAQESNQALQRFDLKSQDFLDSEKLADRTIINKIFCLSSNKGAAKLKNMPKEFFVKFAMKSSYHIPFHSNYENILRIKTTNPLQKLIQINLQKEIKFWDNVHALYPVYVVNAKRHSIKSTYLTIKSQITPAQKD